MIAFGPDYRGESLPQIAHIDESACIGCVKCIRACPVDAIVGAPGQMHTIITTDCTGCELCLPPCPVDCISLVPAPGPPAERQARATHFWQRYLRRQARLATQDDRGTSKDTAATAVTANDRAEKKRYIQAAVARTRRQPKPPST